MAKQFLVIQTAFLGDAVLATALLEKLHAHYPDAAIDLVVRKGNEGLFGSGDQGGERGEGGEGGVAHGHPFLRNLHVWDKRQGKTRALFKLIGQIRKQRYDHVINAQRFFSTGLMTVLSGGKETIGFDKNPLSPLFARKVAHHMPAPGSLLGKPRPAGKPVMHEVDRLNDLIAHLTDGTRPLPKLYPSEADRAAVDHLIGRPSDRPVAYSTIAPASVWFTKQWPASKWIDLIKALPAEQRVFLIGAPADIELCRRIVREAGRGEVLAGQLSLLGTAALMEGAAMNYVNDSAPLHIASAMQAPVTAVFCSTVPAFGFGPLHANGRIVERAVPLYCRPCGLHGYKACPEGHFKCAHQIGLDHVVVR